MAVETEAPDGRIFLLGEDPDLPTRGKPCSKCGNKEYPHCCHPRVEWWIDKLSNVKSAASPKGCVPYAWQREDFIEGALATVGLDEEEDEICWINETHDRMGRRQGKSKIKIDCSAVKLKTAGRGTNMLYAGAIENNAKSLVWNIMEEIIDFTPGFSKFDYNKSTGLYQNPVNKVKWELRNLGVKPGAAKNLEWHWSLCDELGEWRDPEEALGNITATFMTIIKKNPLLMTTTTLPSDTSHWVWTNLEYLKAVKENPDLAPHTKPILYLIDKEHWRDEDMWYRVMPAMRDRPGDLRFMRNEAKKADNDPGERRKFIREYLSGVPERESKYLELEAFNIQPEDWNRDKVFSMLQMCDRVWVGVDLSEVSDLTSMVIYGKYGVIDLLWHISWIPEGAVKDLNKRSGGQVDKWIKEGCLRVLPMGSDGSYVANESLDILKQLRVDTIGYDVAKAEDAAKVWKKKGGYHVEKIGQGGWLTAGIRRFRTRSRAQLVCHGTDPLLGWSVSNVEITYTNADAETIVKPKRDSVNFRADPAVAAATAYQTMIKMSKLAGDKTASQAYSGSAKRARKQKQLEEFEADAEDE